MLKKEETLPGAIVEIFQIKKGVSGYGNTGLENYVLVTKEGGGFLDGGKGVGIGTRFEIVSGPKKRHGINSVIVKFKDGDSDYEGHVNWCELRASCRLVQAAPDAPAAPAKPARKPSGVLKQFSEKQLARLPAMGYWVEKLGNMVTVYCLMKGAVKYVHHNAGSQWSTLLWSCCPTAKQIAAGEHGASYHHYPDHASMLAGDPELPEGARVKAANDF